MRKFDYSFLNNGLLPAGLVNLTASIASLKTMAGVRKEEHLQVFTELEAVAKVQSIKSSNAIEGIVTSDERIAAIVNQNSAPLNHNEAEIAGYRDALNEIHQGHAYIDFRERDILRLHEIMMSLAGYEYGGQYKTDDNVILEVDADGNRRVRFRPIPASETKQAMEQLEMAQENMCPLKSRSITIRHIITKHYGNPPQVGKRTKMTIFPLWKTFYPRYTCAIKNWISALLWFMARRLPRRQELRQPY